MSNQRTDAPMMFDGCDKAVIGFVHRCGQVPIVVYEWDKLIRVFEKQGMSNEEAQEWVAFNCEGAWVGNGTPGILHKGSADEVRETLR